MEVDKTDIQEQINSYHSEINRLLILNKVKEKSIGELELLIKKISDQYTYNEIRIDELRDHTSRLAKLIEADDHQWLEKNNGSPDFLNPEHELDG